MKIDVLKMYCNKITILLIRTSRDGRGGANILINIGDRIPPVELQHLV